MMTCGHSSSPTVRNANSLERKNGGSRIAKKHRTL